jgi:hypothetical protein
VEVELRTAASCLVEDKKIVPARGKRLVTKIERQHVQSCPTSHVTDLPVIVDFMAKGKRWWFRCDRQYGWCSALIT